MARMDGNFAWEVWVNGTLLCLTKGERLDNIGLRTPLLNLNYLPGMKKLQHISTGMIDDTIAGSMRVSRLGKTLRRLSKLSSLNSKQVDRTCCTGVMFRCIVASEMKMLADETKRIDPE